MTTLTILTCILGLFAYAPTTEAAPNCPPRYQEICKQLVKALDDNNNGQFYTWDGTHLTATGNFLRYSSVNNSKTDFMRYGLGFTADQLNFRKDFFPSLLNQIIAAGQGGQTAYFHLFVGWGNQFDNIALSNAPTPKPLGQQPNQKVVVAQPGTAAVMPKPLGQQPNQKVVVPQGIAPTNKPKAVSLTYGLNSKNGTKIDKTTVNGHFVTAATGSLVKKEERSYLLDHNNDVWSCKVSGLGARVMPNEKGEPELAGHVETLKFRSDRLGHIPGNHPMHRGCLISVQQ